MYLETLYQEIEKNRSRSVSGTYFICAEKIRSIFSLDKVELAIQELDCDPHERIGLANKIHQEGIVVFAILVWMRRSGNIVKFREHDCLDTQLPIPETRAQQIVPEFGLSFAREIQWQFLPYVFKKDMCDYHRYIHEANVIFPFVGEAEKIGQGGFGEVTRIQIPTNLQELFHSKEDTVSVIRKRIMHRKKQTQEDYDKSFQKEMKSLRLLHQLKHPNIIPLLGSYTHNEEHNFLFPPFAMDLAKFLDLESRFEDFQCDFMFPIALRGLASALEQLHNISLDAAHNGVHFTGLGYHHDFRPSNILITHDSFILADFGLGEIKPKLDNSQTPWKMGTGDYLAPETMDSSTFAHQSVGRSIDVWAFGCLISEVVSYMERGHQGVRHFRALRESVLRPPYRTTYFFTSDGGLKEYVQRWLEEMGTTSSIITKKMLQVAFRALQPVSGPRCSIKDIRCEFDIISLQALASAVCSEMETYLIAAEKDLDQAGLHMAMRFEAERLHVIARFLSSETDANSSIFSQEETYRSFRDGLRALFATVHAELGHQKDIGQQVDASETRIDLGGSVAETVQQMVQKLWTFLPKRETKRIQELWLSSMQEDDIERLNDIDMLMREHRLEDFADVGLMAGIRATRLQLLKTPDSVVANLLLNREDLHHIELLNGHTYGRFRGDQPVLVEWMYYTNRSDTIPEHQRLLIMELRAESFNLSKPAQLRVLKCLGFVEEIGEMGRRPGYGFLYELPATTSENVFEPPVTLQQLLLLGSDRDRGAECQAPLQGRYLLAHSLAAFFEELYTVGCLHETFNSKNVVFACEPKKMFLDSRVWRQPYIVGFQKSRPDGSSWATDGPADESSYRQYEHPDYREEGRFSLEYDIYSLGLVLLEVGCWIPLQKLAQRREHRTLSPEGFRQALLEKYVPRLTTTVGGVYRDCVRSCLDGSLGCKGQAGSGRETDNGIFGLFLDKVVKPLEKLSEYEI
ncbi:hypothetical protein COCMIDRAFT_3418 [Bipolaris oryzae ATCC 44560]|uniref:Protein kinase domain-containing protein n=1 Tax=Bipolaris oryzae ATCC 44560 TaxID=930090 RepID=W6ZCS9_COCMI|nr:uncharacterized protein COCMIDRAFT_3418 [Bipolaris oryzae ATCC 44560]EUC47623.1 hypothetical protein COCMIDRAFT_3418 [Bipolaris oryzae ATCC 44560]